MVKRLLSWLMLLYSSMGMSQTFGNEWIHYDQTYYAFNIVADGVYRIDYNTLSASGIPLSTITTPQMQLFAREKEIPLHIVDGGDQSFDPGDYLLFFAERNDGWLDSSLYLDPNSIGNPDYSLYNDTIKYFFTWNNLATNQRFAVESDIDYNSYTPSPYWIQTIDKSYPVSYIEGKDASGVSSSFFMPGEGWASLPQNGVSGGYNLAIDTYTQSTYFGNDAPPVIFHGKTVSNSNAFFNGMGNHHYQWRIGPNNYLIHDDVYSGYAQRNVTASFPVSEITGGVTPLSWTIIDDQGATTDFQSISYWSITYPKTPTLNGEDRGRFFIANSSLASKVRLEITNAALGDPIFMVLGPTPKIAPMTYLPGGYWNVLFTNSSNGSRQEVVLQNLNNVPTIPLLTPVNGTGQFTDFSTLSAEKAILMIYHPLLQAATSDYANYRSSAAGGNHPVVLADINELYLQFGGGIPKHIYGIRRFAHLMYQHATEKPVALFLMGKGMREASESNPSTGMGSRQSELVYGLSLIPSYGYPSSDVFITAGLADTLKWVPAIPTGRIAANNNTELANYLQKVKTFDLQQDSTSVYNSATKDWQKQVLHFSGGTTAGEQTTFQGYLSNMQHLVENANYGANVTTYRKVNSDPLDPTLLSIVSQQLENGISLMTFFGHASADGFEINVDEPSNWNNTGKYPVVIGNACYTGDIFQNYPSASEKFVNIPQEGAIAFLSTVKLGFASYLNYYTSELYRQFSQQSYGLTLSEQIRRTIQQLETNGENIITETTCAQMTLHGDPLVKLNWHPHPEIEITQQSIFFQPEDINLSVDSIEMNIILTNLGRSVTDTFSLEVRRNFPTGIDSIYRFSFPELDYKDTFSFKMPLQPNISIGVNQFSVQVDLPSVIAEQYDEFNNNQLNKTLIINIDGIVPVSPYEFAVVPDDSVTVKGSTINPIASFRTYRFELDTTDLFNSPQKRYALISGFGGVKEVNPSQWLSASGNQPLPLICTDSTVYFWRVSLDSSTLMWRESSFQYIAGKQGWGQDHFFQFKKNGFSGIDYNRPDRMREFGPVTRDFSCDVYDNPYTFYTYNATWYKINGDMIDYGMCTTSPSIQVAIIDPVTLEPWGTRYTGPNGTANPDHYFGNANDNGSCRARPEYFFAFRQYDPVSMASFHNLVTNIVPDDYYLLIYSTIEGRFSDWETQNPSIFNTFAALHSDSIVPGRENTSFIFFTRKGDPSSVEEVMAQNDYDFIQLNTQLTGADYTGQETSTLIGPAANWETLYWKQQASEDPSADTTRLYIEAFDLAGNLQLQFDTLFTHKDSIVQLNNLIPASQYPYIRLGAKYRDTITFTPAQIDRWHILYQPLPEAAIDGSTAYSWLPISDTLEEGQEVRFAVDIKNISTSPMDSLLVNYWIEDANRVRHPLTYERQDSLRVSEVLRDTIQFSTVGHAGLNSLWMEVNPYVSNSTTITDQPEQFHFNNLLQIPFYVHSDKINPLLDVTFDGMHILNGDIVSPESELLISLKDENPYLIMNQISDTSLFGIYLTDPNGIQRRIPFEDGNGNMVMQWIPAEAQHKRFKIIYPALFELNGKYTLFVQGSDRSGNLSGDLEYRITFEVVRESSISYLMNYPNPFSTSTRFVFTLTGSEVPDEMLIQIMTVTGKVVREITEDELGPMHIGRNISEFAWDGTDEFGDPLANGVYLYRVLSQLNGENIKHRESGADSHFKKEFGKMYILR